MKLALITDTGEQIEARCDGCRHWDVKRPEGAYESGDHRNDFPHRECSANVHLGTDPDNSARLSYTMDASGFYAVLWTRPEFFCALFEREEDEPVDYCLDHGDPHPCGSCGQGDPGEESA